MWYWYIDQETEKRQNRMAKKAMIKTGIVFCIFMLSLEALKINHDVTSKYGSWGHYWEHEHIKKERPYLAEEFDAARQAYINNVENASLYEIKDSDHVESVSVEVTSIDSHYDSTTKDRIGYWLNYDRVDVTVKMDASFRELPDKDKCYILIGVEDEINQNLADLYNRSRYYQLYEQYKCPYSENLIYKDLHLQLDHTEWCIFTDGVAEYSIYGDFYEVSKKNGKYTTYRYWERNGEIVKFELFHEGSTNSSSQYTSDTDKKQSEDTKNTNSSGKRDTTGSSSGSYDPYDVKDYDSAEKFADDKYEEFYDYEDEYEDEDEAYDAAEDYWYDEY
ncbi:MAG: hypothetical protein K5754_03145 [Butyrivibrio sp.]|jgi:hypothetical protein|nr:hypothetical protein [Butyrivibrio sp.]